MKHVSVYENFGSHPQSVIDFFDLTFTLVLHNRTIIKGLIQNEDAVKELFSDDIQRGLINKCYYNTHRYILNESEVKRAECAEKNIREKIIMKTVMVRKRLDSPPSGTGSTSW